jgi:hypothetical protein
MRSKQNHTIDFTFFLFFLSTKMDVLIEKNCLVVGSANCRSVF